MCCILYALLWYKGNAKILFGIEWTPFQWWLYTGLISSYLGLVSWWHFVNTYTIWGAIAITYFLHAAIELGLSLIYFNQPTTIQYVGIGLLLVGSILVIKV